MKSVLVLEAKRWAPDLHREHGVAVSGPAPLGFKRLGSGWPPNKARTVHTAAWPRAWLHMFLCSLPTFWGRIKRCCVLGCFSLTPLLLVLTASRVAPRHCRKPAEGDFEVDAAMTGWGSEAGRGSLRAGYWSWKMKNLSQPTSSFPKDFSCCPRGNY